jgi:hypothetical protein
MHFAILVTLRFMVIRYILRERERGASMHHLHDEFAQILVHI